MNMSSTIADLEKFKTIGLIWGVMTLLLIVLTIVVYWLFLDSRIKNKKTMLSSFISKYKIVFYTVLYCLGINLLLFSIAIFVVKMETLGTVYGLLNQFLLIAYFSFLCIPRIFIFCLQISVRKEENDEKIKFFEALKLFWSISKKTD